MSPDDPQWALLDGLPDDVFGDLLGPSASSNRRVPAGSDAGESAPLPAPICLLDAPPPEPMVPLVEGLVPAGEPILLAGPGGVGKSTISLAIASAVAGGYATFGAFRVPAGGPVLLVSEEDGLGILLNRAEALVAGHGWDRVRVLGNLHLFALEGVRLDDLGWQLHLARCAADLGAVLVVFDPLADLLSGNENVPSEARVVVQFWRTLARQGLAVLTCHHLAKPKEGYAGQDRVRGAGSWANAARAVYLVSSDADGGITLTCEKFSRAARPLPIELTLTVETDPANPSEWLSARLEAVGDGSDWSLVGPRRLTPAERTALQALDTFRGEGGLTWSRWVEATGLGDKTISRAKKRLTDLGLVVAEVAGRRAGREVYRYVVTAAGIAALLAADDGAGLGGLQRSDGPPAVAPTVGPSPDPNGRTVFPLKGGIPDTGDNGEIAPSSNGRGTATGFGLVEMEPEEWAGLVLTGSEDAVDGEGEA